MAAAATAREISYEITGNIRQREMSVAVNSSRMEREAGAGRKHTQPVLPQYPQPSCSHPPCRFRELSAM